MVFIRFQHKLFESRITLQWYINRDLLIFSRLPQLRDREDQAGTNRHPSDRQQPGVERDVLNKRDLLKISRFAVLAIE